MQNAIFSVIYITALVGTLVLVPGIPAYIFVAACDRRHRRGVVVPLAMLCGFGGGILFIWSLVPRTWTLPLWETFAASVNAEKYGHPVEHYAELSVIWMLFGAVVGAVVSGVAAAMAERLRIRRRPA